MVKEYLYRMEEDSTRSSGCAVAELPIYRYDTSLLACDPNYAASTSIYTMLTSNGNGQPGMTQGAPVGYRTVTVLDGRNGQNGKTVFKYTSAYESPDAGFTDFPFAPSISFEYGRGKLLSTTDYLHTAGGDQLLRSVVHTYAKAGYSSAPPINVTALKIGRTYRDTQCGQLQSPYPDLFALQKYKYITQWMYLAKTVSRQYDLGSAGQYAETTTVYHYGNAQHLQLTHQTQRFSDGRRIGTTYHYPLDMVGTATPTDATSAAIATLVTRHVLTPVLEQQVWRGVGADSVLVGANLTQYAGVQPKRLFQFITSAPVPAGTLTPTIVRPAGTWQQDTRYQETMVFDAYDSVGNLLQQHRSSDQPISYLWGYHGTALVAQVQNATQLQIRTALATLSLTPAAVDAQTTDGNTTDAQLRQLFAQLRQLLPQARLSSFTHRPQVGLTSQTDFSGRTTTYEYDALGRLQGARDERGRILSQQQYHYARRP